MRRYLKTNLMWFWLTGFTLCTVAHAGEENPPDPLKVVFIAYENPDQLVDDVRPVVAYFKGELGLPVRHFVATDYSGVVEALRNKSADMGFMGPLQYVIAHQQAGAYPILGELYNGKPTYVSRIFVRRDSGIRRPADLQGRTVAFVDPISSSGFLYPLDIFKTRGLVGGEPEDYFKKIYFAGGDEQAIRAVYNGFVDAAGIGQYAERLLRPEERDDVVSIADSRAIPSHCVVVRKDLHRGTVAKLKQMLLELDDDEAGRKLLKYLYNVDGYIPVSHEDYREVEELARLHGFVK